MVAVDLYVCWIVTEKTANYCTFIPLLLVYLPVCLVMTTSQSARLVDSITDRTSCPLEQRSRLWMLYAINQSSRIVGKSVAEQVLQHLHISQPLK